MSKIPHRPAQYLPVNDAHEVDCPTCDVAARAKLDRYGNVEWRGCSHAIGTGSNGTRLTVGFVEEF